MYMRYTENLKTITEMRIRKTSNNIRLKMMCPEYL